MNFISSQAFRYSVSVIFLCLLSVVNSFAQSASEWQDISLTGADGFSIDAEYRYKISSQTGSWLYAKEVSARNLVTNESYFGQIFYVSADNKKSYQYNGNFLDTVVQIQKRTLPTWTDVVLNNTDPFNTAYEYRFKMTVPGRPGVPAGDFWYYAKQVGAQSLVMDNGYGEITFVSAANKTAYLAQGTPTGITISKMERRALTWNDVPLDTTDAYDVSCEYRFKMNYQASPQWRPGVPAGDFWHYPERASAQSLIANANGGYQTFSVFANNKMVFDFNGVNNNTVLQMQKLCNVPVSTCGNPRAQINFVPYDGIPAADQNSSTNAWDSITLGNKAVVAGGTFFDLTDGTNAIDDGTIVSTGLQNFAVSRHNGYIEFLALGRRLSTYYGYYQGTIKFENVQVDRVEPGLTTATWADVGLEATEGDLVTKVSDNEISFKLAFANQGDGFRVYLKSPTPTECACSAGQEKRSDPKSPVCIVRALVKGVQDTQFILTGYNHLVGNCTLAAGTPQAPQTPSTEIIVTAGQQRTSWMQGSPWTFQLDPLLTCPANTTKTACMFTYGAGPLGEITCGCYPNENTNNPKNLSCRTFTDPLINNLPVFARDASPAQFCREQGYSQSATVGTEYDYLGNGSLWNGTVWEINNHLAAIREVSCCKLEDKTSNICVYAGCAEGQYWCQTENICKPAGQTCNKNDTVGITVNWVGYSAHTASTATGSIQVGGKTIQANYTGDIAGFGITGESQWNVANGNPTLFPNGIADNVPDQSNIIWNSGGTQTINKITFSEPVINPVMVIYSLGWNTVEYQFNQPFNLIKNTPDVKKLAGNVLQGTGGYGLIQFQGTFSELSFKNPILEATYTIGTAGFNFGVFPVSTVPSVTCNNNNTCEAGESCNCGDCTNGGADDADKCGLSNNAQMLCTKDVKNATTSLTPTTQKWVAYTYPGYASSYIYISKLPTETHTVAGQTFYVYNPERVIRGMSEATFMANPEEAIKNAPVVPVGNTRWTERLIFNLAQLESEAATTQTATLNALTSSVAHRYMCTENVVGATNCSNNSNMGWTPGFGKSQGGDIYVSASNSGGGVAFAKGQILGTFDVADSTCQLHTTSSLRYVPNTDPRTQGWLNINGIGTAQNDGGKSVWQVNDGGNDSGDNAVVYKKFTTTELNDFFTRGGKYSVELKNISASAPTSGAAYLLASYLEIARGANTTKGARRFTFVFGLDADKTPTIIGLTNNGTTYIAPSNSTYKYRVDGGANKYNTYEMLYDPATDTVDMFVNGVERISNFPGNTVAPGYATAIRDTAAIIFGSGTSPGVANTNYGNISVVIKNNCSGSTVQVGACCPAGAQWDSSQGKCALEAVPGCAEGEYYCHAELKCKAAGESCGTVTCNNNNVCDANESCDCADCNEKVDHCGLSGSGEQLICTKDTAEKCYTDKFPYCLSACLDGYKMDTNGQCIPVAPVGVPQTCTVRSVQGIEGSVALCNAGEVRVGGGCENTNGGAYRFFTFPLVKGETWWNYTNVAENGWACGSGSTGTYTKAYAICCSAPTTGTYEIRKGAPGIGSKAECLAGEVRTGGGCKNLGGSAFLPVSYPLAAGSTFGSVGTVTNDGWGCATGASDTTTEAYAICYNPGTGPSFTTTIRTQVGTELATAECQPGEVRTGGGCSLLSGTAYHYAIFPSLAGVFNGYGTPTNDGFVCATGSTGTYTQAYAVCASKVSNNSGTNTTGSQNFTYPIKIDGYVKNDTASATKFCTEKGFTSVTIVSSDSSGARKMGWNGTSWVADNSGGSYIKLLTCSGGTPQNYTCQSYTGNIQTHGGYLSIQPQSTTQFCKEAGYDFPQLTSQYSTSSSCRLWNGTSWYEDVACVAVSGLQCCTNPTTPVGNTSITEPQLGACCPPGSAWNSVENRCVPTTCGEGQFYCAAQKKCLAGGQTCDTAVCNNDGVCSGDESCQCGDCVNGGVDDKDKCSIVGGAQAICSDDNLSDGKPGACCVPPKKWNSTTNTCVECSNTQAPSELKAGVDQPYITCTGNGDTTKTHFKYRITKQGSTDAPFISEIFTVGTPVLHPTMTLGDYTVECFYGNATGVDTSTTATPHSCVKTMSVKTDAQGCSRVYPYKGSTLSDEMTSASAFDASFRCGSRKPVVGTITNPYMFRVGTQTPSYLSFDALISELFNGLTIGPVSTQTQNYDFDTGNTDVTCATKVGGGYSTNTACQLRTCVGGACNVPQTFSVVHSDDLICTTEETSTYNIGCNPAAPDSVRNQCIQWFRDAVSAGSRNVSNGVEFNVSFAFNTDAPTNVSCIKYVAGQMPGGLNLSDNVVCRATLKNGERYQIYAADTNGRIDALQTTAKTVERDREAPTMAEIKYYTDETLTTEVPSTQWYNKPVIALAVCSDTPLNEATSCACAQRIDTTTTDADSWSLGVPNSLIGADLMRYTRTITETLTGTQKVQVVDTAGNTSTAKNIAVSLDTQTPLVTPTESGTGATRTITLTASDTGSKIWKTTGAPSGATNTSGIIYRIGPKADMATLAFDTACNTTATYATVAETQSASYPSQATVTISNLNTATQVVAYCVRDNAGNTTRGMYPVAADACFSATNMSTIPNLDTYKPLLKTRLTATGNDNQKYGYSFSENTADASCFRGILSTNITTLMTNQLKSRTATTLSNWDRDRAELSTSTTLSNGYYYYVYPTSNTLNIVTSPSGGAPVKSVVVEGGDIRIKTDINYSGAGKTLLLIARKNSNGQGGNIIIDTNVKNIDAILIADGGALRSSDATLPGERLTINGRLYSYNTRGGSLAVSGADFIDSTTPKKFTNSSLVNASSLNDARTQDLERFRPLFADGNNACSLVVNYQTFTTANLPALLKRPNTFTGGSCGF